MAKKVLSEEEKEFFNFCQDHRWEYCWTPDLPELETVDSHYVFVYGTRRGMNSNYFSTVNSDATFMGNYWTKSSIYAILKLPDSKDSLKVTPLLSPTGKSQVIGDLYSIPTEEVLDLDADEHNDFITQRIKIPVTNGTWTVMAWTYMIHPKMSAKYPKLEESMHSISNGTGVFRAVL
jgi:gamma-glutamylcyclotransferase (GGCT)/AIG2-like uncharacterized protein YtfP